MCVRVKAIFYRQEGITYEEIQEVQFHHLFLLVVLWLRVQYVHLIKFSILKNQRQFYPFPSEVIFSGSPVFGKK